MWLRRLGWVAILCLTLVAACSQDIEGLRTPRSAASQSLGIRWRAGAVAIYRWTLETQFADRSSAAQKVAGDCDETVLSVDSSHTARLQLTFRIDPQYVSGNQTGIVSHDVAVDARGRISSNPDGAFGDLPDLHTVIPLLPPPGSGIGSAWSEKYVLPNPSIGDTRSYALSGEYLRNEGTGLSRLVVIQVHMLANVDETFDYAAVIGPLPAGSPPHVTVHQTGTEILDTTYSYDPIHQALMKSVSRHDINFNLTLVDASTGKAISRVSNVGTETVTFTRS